MQQGKKRCILSIAGWSHRPCLRAGRCPTNRGGHHILHRTCGQAESGRGVAAHIHLYVAATDYALLLVSRFREELHGEASTWVALAKAWRGAVEPIAASAATVILGLLCLLLASLQNTAGLGPVGALGIAGALLASLTFLPAVLLVFGRKAFWPFAPRVDDVHAEDVVGTRSLWGRIAGLVGRHPRRTWVITLVTLLAAASFAPTFRAEGVSIKDTFLTATDSVQAQDAIERHFAAGAGNPIQVIVPADRAEAVRAALADDSGIEDAYIGLTPAVPGQDAPEPAPVDGLQLVQGTATGSADSQAAEETVRRLRVSLDKVSPDALVGGQAAINLDVLDASGRDLRVIVPASVARSSTPTSVTRPNPSTRTGTASTYSSGSRRRTCSNSSSESQPGLGSGVRTFMY